MIFKNISDTDCRLMGYNPEMNRPEDLIIKSFPIPPVIIRPTAKIDFSIFYFRRFYDFKNIRYIKSKHTTRKQLDKESITGEESNII